MSYRRQFCHGIEVSKNAVDKRFNDRCVDFIKAVRAEVLQERYRGSLCTFGKEVLGFFHRVRIKD